MNYANFRLLLVFLVTLPITLACGFDSDDSANEEARQTSAIECDGEPVINTTNAGIEFVRTPDSCFEVITDWLYEPHYVDIEGLRQAYIDEGPADGPVVLLLHGQPSWSYLYRKMIPVLADAGYRVIAMDHLGMGRSDKPTDIADYSYLNHNERLEQFIQSLSLTDINLFVQDWGSLIGLRVAGLHPEWFARIAVGDGTLPVIPAGFQPFPPVENPNELEDITPIFAGIPDQQVPFYNGCTLLLPREDNSYFGEWMAFALKGESFQASKVVEALTWFDLPDADEAAYDAPFPSRVYMAGPRVFPSLVNEVPGTTAEAWAGLMAFEKPFLTVWAANDAGQLGSCETQNHLVNNIPGAEGQPHDRLAEASHFLQDDQGEAIAERLVTFFATNQEGENEGSNTQAAKVGFEILQILSPSEIITWLSVDLTQEEFDAIQLPLGWFKNQPREGEPDGGEFARSPSASEDGELLVDEHFGHQWRHVATIVQTNVQLDNGGLLVGSTVNKYHQVTYNVGSRVSVLISPDNDAYIRVSRDALRTSENPTIPSDWQLTEYVLAGDLVIQLPEETTVIRADNQDSFQGPIDDLVNRISQATGAHLSF